MALRLRNSAVVSRLRSTMFAFLSRDDAGVILAGVVAGKGAALAALGLVRRSIALVTAGAVLASTSLAMLGGAVRAMRRTARARAQHPPPGTMVDIGGYRIHVLAEGDARGSPSVVWMPGAHMGGFGFYHLHRELRKEMRSILIDRPGSGWSGAGPFPRTTAREAEEVVAALERAGERGPFIFAGHSFGGLLVANIARRHPELAAAVILLDATPPDTIVYGPQLGAGRMSRDAAVAALRRMFGAHVDSNARAREKPEYARLLDRIDEQLGAEGKALNEIESNARSLWAASSIFEELKPQKLAGVAWQTVVYDGALDGLPVFLVAPGDVGKDVDALTGFGSELPRLKKLLERSRERYLFVSDRSERIYAPAGTGHNFPSETPEFVLDVVRRIAAGVANGAETVAS